MSLFSKLFGIQSQSNKEKIEVNTNELSNDKVDSNTEIQTEIENEVMIGITQSLNFKQPENTTIVYESKIPESTNIGNLNYEKKFDEAVELGNKLLEKTPRDAGVHVNLMVSYFKIRNEKPENFDKYIHHAKLAMLYGHNTGYVQQKLAISLEKQGYFYQALQICNIVLSENFHFSSHGCGRMEDFEKRKAGLEKKLNKSTDKETDKFFTDKEIVSLIEKIRKDDERELKMKIAYELKMKKWKDRMDKML